MERYNLLVIGAGPAGLSAAIEAASKGMTVMVFDENAKPGGQLFKQVHKFFGSKEHMAKIRGFRIGTMLLEEAKKLEVDVKLNAVVLGIYENHVLSVKVDEKIQHYKGDNIIIATGASEKMIPFQGWTMPGVIGAGAAQTMMNMHGIMPGKRVLMVGSGNVGLVVSYQLKQAGCEVVAVIDGASKIGGYGVHAAKVARMGVPFYMSHTVKMVMGNDKVEKVIINQVDNSWRVIPDTEKELEVDTVCIAVGLKPMAQLAKMAGCRMIHKGDLVPECNEYGETSISGIFAAGDVAGIEEASSAMITGKIAAIGALKNSGYMSEEDVEGRYKELQDALGQLRQGMFTHENKNKSLVLTDEGYKLSQSLLTNGYIDENELEQFENLSLNQISGIHPVIECTQNIPCNPCQNACKFGCIRVGDKISNLPMIDKEKKCTGCGMCVASCSGQAIFLIDKDYEEGFATIAMPYEMLPSIELNEIGVGLDRSGKEICQAEVVGIKHIKAFDKTSVLTIKVPIDAVDSVRCYRREGE